MQKWYRVSKGREATPNEGCIDSQSTKIASRFAWFSRFRRLNSKYELLSKTYEALFCVGMIQSFLKRLLKLLKHALSVFEKFE
ncbi:MAG: hypothetical protein WCQ26_05570 [Pseudanabaena sp. ELA748]